MSRPPGPPEHRRKAGAECDREQDLDRSAGERHHSNRSQLAEGHFEPERKEEERDPDLGELLDVVDVDDGQAAREGADGDSRQDVADDERLPGALCQVAAGQGGGQDQGEIGNESHLDGSNRGQTGDPRQ